MVTVACSVQASAWAAAWTVRPAIDVTEVYTDNIRLAPAGRESSDLITQVIPGVSVTGDSPRLKLQANYRLQFRNYANGAAPNGYSHFLQSNATLELLERHLFLDASATSGVQNLSLTGAQGTTNQNVTGNVATVQRIRLSPHWVNRLGDFGSVRARYTWDQLESGGAGAALDSDLNAVDLELRSGPVFNRMGWSFAYRNSQTSYTSAAVRDREFESVTANASYLIEPSLRAVVSAGRDKGNYQTNAFVPSSGTFWTTGLEWRPSPRTSVSGRVGERYYGPTRAFDASYRAARWNVTAGYSDQVVETPLRFGVPATADTAAAVDRLFLSRIPDAVERQQAVEAFIVQNGLPGSLESPLDFVTGQVYTTKRLHAGGSLLGPRYTIVANMFLDRRANVSAPSFLPGDAFAVSNEIDQAGFTLTGSYRVTPQTSTSLTLARVRTTFSSANREDDTIRIVAGLTHRFHPRLSGRVDLRVVDRESTTAAQSYREHALVGSMRVDF